MGRRWELTVGSSSEPEDVPRPLGFVDNYKVRLGAFGMPVSPPKAGCLFLQEENRGPLSKDDAHKDKSLKQKVWSNKTGTCLEQRIYGRGWQVAMEIAQAPAKSLPMQAIMMYMSGSSVSIISIMIVGMCLVSSIKALAALNKSGSRAWENEGCV
jgi:hypothetical protein